MEPHTVAYAGPVEESIHLTAAFLLVGFPQVIGTLWRTNDYCAAKVARMFYAVTKHRTNDGAAALNTAVRRFRDAFPGAVALWTAYAHTGV